MRISDPASGRRLFLSACVFLPLSPVVVAAEDPVLAALDPIVVTATIGPRTVGESLSSVTTIDDDTIREQQPAEFSDLLRSQPGINVISNGSFGKNTSIYTRGTGSESTVFLVDGIRVRSSTSGSAPWQYFPVDLVDRVEIVRGPRSSLYGADAVGGVVQAFTYEPGIDGPRGWVEAGGGSFNTGKGSGGISARAGNTRFSLSGIHTETDGTRIVEGGDDKGFRNTSGIARVVHELANGGEAGLMLMQSQGNTEFEGGDTDYMIRLAGFRLATPVSEYWDTAIQVSEARDEQDNFRDSGDSVFNTTARSARWENTIYLSSHELAVGAELLNEEVNSTTEFDEDSRSNAAAFSQLRLGFGPTDVQFSLRLDDNEAYGQEETGGVALGHAFDDHHRVRASYQTSFRAPTFNDLYYPLETYSFGGSYAGNPDLDPEKGQSVELGLSGRYDIWFWDAAIYQLDVDNLIALETDSAGNMRPANVDDARIRGLELTGGLDYEGWRAQAAVTLTDPRDRDTDNRLRRRTGKQFRLDLDRDFLHWNLGATLNAEGYRYDDAANDNRLPGFATLDLRAGWRFAPSWSTRLTVDNVFDREYATAERFDGKGYLAAGRTAMLTVRYDIH